MRVGPRDCGACCPRRGVHATGGMQRAWWCGQVPDIAWLCMLHTSLYSTHSLPPSLGPLHEVLTRCLAVLGCAVIVSVPLRVCKTVQSELSSLNAHLARTQ